MNSPQTSSKGTGYAVASLEAALWCFEGTDTSEAVILAAANLGDDADTTAAVAVSSPARTTAAEPSRVTGSRD